MALPFPQIRAMRRVAESLMFRPCTIKRDDTLLNPQPTMSDGKPLRCSIDDDTDHTIPGADSTQTMRRVMISLPHKTPVLVGDQITADNVVYGVSEPPTDETDSSETIVYAYALYPLDAEGNPGPPLYLRFNGTITTQRENVSGNVLTAVDAQIEPAKMMESPIGPQRSQKIQIGPHQDILPGDLITVTYNSGTVREGKATFTDEIDNGGMQSITITVAGGLLMPT